MSEAIERPEALGERDGTYWAGLALKNDARNIPILFVARISGEHHIERVEEGRVSIDDVAEYCTAFLHACDRVLGERLTR